MNLQGVLIFYLIKKVRSCLGSEAGGNMLFIAENSNLFIIKFSLSPAQSFWTNKIDCSQPVNIFVLCNSLF